jgi:hypothetical protein
VDCSGGRGMLEMLCALRSVGQSGTSGGCLGTVGGGCARRQAQARRGVYKYISIT